MLPYTDKWVCNLVDFNPQNLPRNVWHAIQILTSKPMVPLRELMAEGFTEEFGHENMRKKLRFCCVRNARFWSVGPLYMQKYNV
jgi:hypothetical protein